MLWALHGHERVRFLQGNGTKNVFFLQYYSSIPAVFTVLFEGQLFWSLQIFEAFLYYLLVSFIVSRFSIRRSWRSCVCRQSSPVVALDVFACLLPGQPFTFSTSSAVWEVWIGRTRTLTLVLTITSTILYNVTRASTQSIQLFTVTKVTSGK